MTTNINNPAYSTLNTYAVLASSGITTVNTTTITNGDYGSSPTATYTGAFVGTVDSANALTAQTELTAFVGAVNTLRVGLPTTINPGTVISAITLYPNINYTDSAIIFQGVPIILDALGDVDAKFFITATAGLTFNNVPSITLVGGASNCNVIWLATAAIAFAGTLPPTIPGIFIAGSAITLANGSQVLGRLYAQTANVTFSGTTSVDALCTQSVVCYAKGTLILTKEGYVPIESIKAGDKVMTKGTIYKNNSVKTDAKLSLETVVWTSKFKVKKLDKKSRPICITKDALGKNAPFTDLYVSPNHSLLLNGRMVLAKRIVNGKTIYQDEECESVEYYHLECYEHSAIIANGVLSESYLDTMNRDSFEKSARHSNPINFKKMYTLRG